MNEHPSPEESERRLEVLIGRLLQIGVLASAALVLAGGVMMLVHHGAAISDFRAFVGAPEWLRSVAGIFRAALALDSLGLLQLGLILLIATPVARVAFTLVAFAIQRDRIYVVLTAIVLVALLYGLVWSPG